MESPDPADVEAACNLNAHGVFTFGIDDLNSSGMGPRGSTAFDTLLSSITAKSQLSNNLSPVTKCVCSTTSSGQLTGSDELAGTSTVQALIKLRF
ncbi:uncharacterized protein PITG_22823 [Phytophthora infestans T30-4]|uniref:Expressed protein n=1 Tax=Phytophthora infestans (strain T30-4) TaxID=403677 RepID=D0N8J0_PHYIT|nr:uncharacterized protein PITG_22823 [Phytophthora infestans T30-4]EEY53875.1 expressed protein [Phytophthora infestans T30-4]|eukprot:XP_002904506.1 expressed protein [Phytophthora infestans T30-4]